MRDVAFGVLLLAGVGLICVGLAMWAAPLALIFAGSCCLILLRGFLNAD